MSSASRLPSMALTSCNSHPRPQTILDKKKNNFLNAPSVAKSPASQRTRYSSASNRSHLVIQTGISIPVHTMPSLHSFNQENKGTTRPIPQTSPGLGSSVQKGQLRITSPNLGINSGRLLLQKCSTPHDRSPCAGAVQAQKSSTCRSESHHNHHRNKSRLCPRAKDAALRPFSRAFFARTAACSSHGCQRLTLHVSSHAPSHTRDVYIQPGFFFCFVQNHLLEKHSRTSIFRRYSQCPLLQPPTWAPAHSPLTYIPRHSTAGILQLRSQYRLPFQIQTKTERKRLVTLAHD